MQGHQTEARVAVPGGDALGTGPLVLFIHGFPDQWYAWRHQMAALADDYQVVAISQRGYNRSDKPTGVEHYDVEHLTGDVAAVIRHLGRESAVIVGHDWGGIVAWFFGERYPEMIDGPKVMFPAPVLEFHGLEDRAYVNDALNGTWEWMSEDLTLITLPGVNHNSQNTGDIPFVTGMLQAWLELKGFQN